MLSGNKQNLTSDLQMGKLAKIILDSVSSGIVIIDHLGFIVYANPASEKILDVSFQRIKGLHYAKAFPQIPRNQHFTLMTLETGQEFTHTGYKQARYNNMYCTTETMLLKNQAGDIIGAAGIFKDITHIYDLHQQLRESHKISMLGHMAAGMAHDILNPLTTAMGFTQMLLQKASQQQLDTDEARQFLQVTLDEQNTINNSLQNFIKVAKFKPMTMQPVDLNTLVYQTVALISNTCNEKGINLKLDLVPNVITMGDEVSLQQSLLHVLDNALDVLTRGEKVSISTDKDELSAYLIVSDNGSGINQENLEAVFTPFFSTHIDKKGMGLPIAERIIHSHSGDIKADSTPGLGTCLTIKLPLVSQ